MMLKSHACCIARSTFRCLLDLISDHAMLLCLKINLGN